MDEIRIDKLEIYAHHGVMKEEKEDGQLFYVNAILYADLHKAGVRDDLTLSTHYGEVSELIEKSLTEHNYNLIETAAETTAQNILLNFPNIKAVSLEVCKPDAPIQMTFECVSVKIYRKWHQVYLSFGSNMGDSRQNILTAMDKLKEDKMIRVERMSEIVTTKPYGGVEQPDFLNGAVRIKTLYTPEELLIRLHEIEQEAGRERTIHWGPRTLDLDILLYDDLIYEDEQLTIPHIDMQNREFVLLPMTEIAPRVKHPVYNKTMQELLEALYAN